MSKFYHLKFFDAINEISTNISDIVNNKEILSKEKAKAIFTPLKKLIRDFKSTAYVFPYRILRSKNVALFERFVSLMKKLKCENLKIKDWIFDVIIEFERFFHVQCMIYLYDVTTEIKKTSNNQNNMTEKNVRFIEKFLLIQSISELKMSFVGEDGKKITGNIAEYKVDSDPNTPINIDLNLCCDYNLLEFPAELNSGDLPGINSQIELPTTSQNAENTVEFNNSILINQDFADSQDNDFMGEYFLNELPDELLDEFETKSKQIDDSLVENVESTLENNIQNARNKLLAGIKETNELLSKRDFSKEIPILKVIILVLKSSR